MEGAGDHVQLGRRKVKHEGDIDLEVHTAKMRGESP